MIKDNKYFNPHFISCSEMPITSNPTPGIPFGGRVVRWYEIEMFTETSQGHIVHVDHRIPARKGLLMIRQPGMVVRGISSYGCYSLAFDSLYTPSLEEDYKANKFTTASVDILKRAKEKDFPLLKSLPESVMVSDYSLYQGLFEEAVNLSLKAPNSDSVKGKRIIFTLLDLITTDVEKSKQVSGLTSNHRAIIQQSLLRMESHLAQPISLTDLAKEVGYTREAYCRLFTKAQGISPIEWLIRRRITEAKKLLMTTNMPIKDIANQCGFNSDTHLYTTFRKREGMSPGSYRKAHRPL